MAAAKKAPEITYGRVACTAEGVLFSTQSAAGRSKKAALVLRYDAPGARGEIVYEHGKKFDSVWTSAGGVCHVVSSDGFHHSNESGSWKKTRVTKERNLLGLGGVGDALFASTYKGHLFSRSGGEWREVLIDDKPAGTSWFDSFAGSGADDIYAVSNENVLHFDGNAWRALETPSKGPRSVVALAKDEVYIASYSGLARGNAKSKFTTVASTKLQHAATLDGVVYAAAYSDGIYRWDGKELAKLEEPEISVWSFESGKYLCAAGMQPGIYSFDGKSWTITT